MCVFVRTKYTKRIYHAHVSRNMWSDAYMLLAVLSASRVCPDLTLSLQITDRSRSGHQNPQYGSQNSRSRPMCTNLTCFDLDLRQGPEERVDLRLHLPAAATFASNHTSQNFHSISEHISWLLCANLPSNLFCGGLVAHFLLSPLQMSLVSPIVVLFVAPARLQCVCVKFQDGGCLLWTLRLNSEKCRLRAIFLEKAVSKVRFVICWRPWWDTDQQCWVTAEESPFCVSSRYVIHSLRKCESIYTVLIGPLKLVSPSKVKERCDAMGICRSSNRKLESRTFHCVRKYFGIVLSVERGQHEKRSDVWWNWRQKKYKNAVHIFGWKTKQRALLSVETARLRKPVRLAQAV